MTRSRARVEPLGGAWRDRVEVWGARLRVLNVDLDNAHDPLVAQWRTLAYNENPGGLTDFMWEPGRGVQLRFGPTWDD